jgi:uncharacterized damage-inducible protein DinB
VLLSKNSEAAEPSARVPEDRFEWQPHPKSMTLGRLATHVADLVGFVATVLETDGVDSSTRPAPSARAIVTRQQLLDRFEANLSRARASLAQSNDAALSQPWTRRRGEQIIFEMPRGSVLRSMMMDHLIHHRGQVTVYLRLNEVPLPGMYGPSADEQ